MVYNFALPPLVLHTFHTGSCGRLAGWARTLEHVSDTATYFNFLASHDGIGLLGAKDILTADEIDALVARCQQHGGLVSYRSTGDGGKSPYELNITWYSALNREDAGEPQALQVDRFMAARAISFVLRGVPGIYLPSLFGAKNDTAAIVAGREARAINRKTVDEEALFALLGDRHSWVHQVAARSRRLLRRRTAAPAFHPNAHQTVLDAGDHVFAVRRETRDGRERVVALTNVTAREQAVSLTAEQAGGAAPWWRDLVAGQSRAAAASGGLELRLRPYAVLWLTPEA
jgi:sucrose phosphorylase